jgi:hypothetical protein
VRDASEAGRSEGLETAIDALRGELTVIGEKMERVFALLDEGEATAFVSGKLRELEERKAIVEVELRGKEVERARASNGRAQGGEHLRTLIEKLQGGGDGDDVFRLRSAISSRLRAVVSVIMVAPLGTTPLVEKWVRNAAGQPGSESIIEYLKRESDDRRHFAVMFVDGSMRAVYPDPADPFKVVQQNLSDKEMLYRLGPGGEVIGQFKLRQQDSEP